MDGANASVDVGTLEGTVVVGDGRDRDRANTTPRRSGGPIVRQRARPHPTVKEEKLATALGWFSIGLGLAEFLAPRQVARLIGIEESGGNELLLRGLGLRELTSGLGILTTRAEPTRWVWSRVAGDAMDLALLGAALASDQSKKERELAATAAVLGVATLDLVNGMQLQRDSSRPERVENDEAGVPVRAAITIGRPRAELYAFWRDFANLPRIMQHVEEVHVLDERRSHWVVKAPAGKRVEWDAEVTADTPDEYIAWRSTENADLFHAGSVSFRDAPADRGTEIHVELHYAPPGGKLGDMMAKLFRRSPSQEIREDLRSFKQMMETGVTVTETPFTGVSE